MQDGGADVARVVVAPSSPLLFRDEIIVVVAVHHGIRASWGRVDDSSVGGVRAEMVVLHRRRWDGLMHEWGGRRARGQQ